MTRKEPIFFLLDFSSNILLPKKLLILIPAQFYSPIFIPFLDFEFCIVSLYFYCSSMASCSDLLTFFFIYSSGF